MEEQTSFREEWEWAKVVFSICAWIGGILFAIYALVQFVKFAWTS